MISLKQKEQFHYRNLFHFTPIIDSFFFLLLRAHLKNIPNSCVGVITDFYIRLHILLIYCFFIRYITLENIIEKCRARDIETKLPKKHRRNIKISAHMQHQLH